MGKILGYGEDALTLWAMKNCITDVLRRFHDETPPSDCLIFYRQASEEVEDEKALNSENLTPLLPLLRTFT